MRKKAIIVSVVILLLVTGFVLFGNRSYSIEEEEEKIFQISLDNIRAVEDIETATHYGNPVINNNKIENINLTVKNPGDYITFDFDIKNTGNQDGKISKISIINNNCESEDEDADAICNNISVDLTYKNSNKEVKENDIIFANSTNPINATIIYNNGPNVKEDIEATIDNLNIEFEIIENS